jgi:hypothetical protein
MTAGGCFWGFEQLSYREVDGVSGMVSDLCIKCIKLLYPLGGVAVLLSGGRRRAMRVVDFGEGGTTSGRLGNCITPQADLTIIDAD